MILRSQKNELIWSSLLSNSAHNLTKNKSGAHFCLSGLVNESWSVHEVVPCRVTFAVCPSVHDSSITPTSRIKKDDNNNNGASLVTFPTGHHGVCSSKSTDINRSNAVYIKAREMDSFSAQKSGQKLQERGISKFGRHQCCIVVGAASGRFSHEILRKIDKPPTQYSSLLPLCIVYSDRIDYFACRASHFSSWSPWWPYFIVHRASSIGSSDILSKSRACRTYALFMA